MGAAYERIRLLAIYLHLLNMKIGILTFHYCKNFGAFLQAFALKHYLEDLGHDVFFVNYKVNSLLRRYTLFPYYKERSFAGNIKANVCAIFKMKRRLMKINRFNAFSKKYSQERGIYSRKDADLIIVGSDQVWNPKLTYGLNQMYYGILAEKYNIPHYTYAVSCPTSLLMPDVKIYLSNFKKIGVRERDLQLKLKSIFGIDSEVNLDPTLLFTSIVYNKLLECQPILQKHNYLLSYNLMSNKRQSEYAIKYAKEQNLAYVGMHDMIFETAGPLEFLSLIKNATYIFSSSFHGTVFAILFHKKFICFLSGDERDERIESLLKSLELEQCIYSKDNLSFPDINWIEVDKKLEDMRQKSKQYITSILKEVDK